MRGPPDAGPQYLLREALVGAKDQRTTEYDLYLSQRLKNYGKNI